MPLTRALTAALLLAGFVAALFLLDPGAFSMVIGGIVVLAAAEWARLTGFRGFSFAAYFTSMLGVYAVALWLLRPISAVVPALLVILSAATVFWMVAVPWWLVRGVRSTALLPLRAAGFAVLLPAGLAMAHLPPGRLLLLLGFVWVADTAAYAVGRALGRHRLAPDISPGKTWEGVAGAAVGCLLYAMICAMAVPGLAVQVGGSTWAGYLCGAVLLCCVSIIGDLFESAVKRQAGRKDSGALLPGHGGVLDRIDSASSALPVGALLLAVLGSP